MAAGAGSAILKRLAALNRSGVLAKPLQFSTVKADLTSIGEDAALKILNQLEVEAARVPEPVEYVRNAVTSAQLDPAIGRKRKAAGSEESGVVKRIRLLNDSGTLAQPILLDKTLDVLGCLGPAKAMTILGSLERMASGVENPTAYIRTAVRQAGGDVPEDPEVDEDDALGDPYMEAPVQVKQEGGRAPGRPVKHEVAGRDFRGAKAEDLNEIDRIERHIGWLNRNKPLMKPIDAAEVLPALDCIGYRQAMRVMRRFEENCETLPEPAEYIKDLVARSGWIWAKPDILDDDEKVAKRVAWLNQFGGLRQQIDYAQVADTLDGLKVAHAMVLLRELEVQSHQIESPTEHIKRAVGSAGKDEMPAATVASDSSIARRVAALNQSGVLAANIELAAIGSDLARLGEAEAAQLLLEVESKGASVKDPTGFIKFKMKAKLAALPQETVSDETKILKRIEWLNDYGGLMQDIDYSRVSTALEIAGLDHSMSILKELEDNKRTARDPNTFIMSRVKSSWQQAAGRGAAAQEPDAAPVVPGGPADFKSLTNFMNFLGKSPKVKKHPNLAEVAAELDLLGPKKASQVMSQMQVHGLGLDDPITYIRAMAQRGGGGLSKVKQEAGEDGDDVAKITKRLKWLNQFAGLRSKVKVNDVVGALYCLGIPQTMEILSALQQKASRISDPTKYIKASVQRANGVAVTEEDDEFEEAEEEEEEAEMQVEDPYADMQAAEDAAEEGILDFDVPEGEEEDGGEQLGEPMVEFEVEDEGNEVALEDEYGLEEGGEDEYAAMGMAPQPDVSSAAPRRVVGGLSGATGRLVPTRKNYSALGPNLGMVKAEEGEPEPLVSESLSVSLGMMAPPLMTPQEKLLKCREYALKRKLDLSHECLKNLARLAWPRAKDLLDETALGGRDRTGVRNPNTYVLSRAKTLMSGLGVEQGLAMELAVSLGVVLNNDALDELASVNRRQGQFIIRELSRNADARTDPVAFIQTEVLKMRAQAEAKPWPPTG